MTAWWRNLSVIKKLYAVVGLMAILIASELFTLLFAMSTLSSVRAFVAGEGLWTKAQKDAVFSLYQYALYGDPSHYKEFQSRLKINDGDHVARIELTKGEFNYAVVREGFLQGGNHPSDIDGMIRLLVRFNDISYIHNAIIAWTQADGALAELRVVADEIHRTIQSRGLHSPHLKAELDKIPQINTVLERAEIEFSSSLGAGSRWLERLLMIILALTVFTVESTGIFLTFRFSRNLSESLDELMGTANAVGKGDFSVRAPVRSQDELGRLAEALNRMIYDLKISGDERALSKLRLQELNEELERRVEMRTREAENREARLSLITNALPELVAQLDANERFLFANEAFCSWFKCENVIGKSFKDILGDFRYPANKPYVDRVLRGEVAVYERISQVAGDSVIYNITLMPVIDKQRHPDGFILVANDVTKYKEIERDLIRAKEAADVANETKSAFLANMSHEIRTPLGAILGFSELMLGSGMSEDERKSGVEIIKRNGQQLSNIINDILDLSKVEAGKLEVERVDVPLAEIQREIESLLSLKASEKGLKLTVISEGAVPSIVKTDPLRLRQVLLNIVGNAIKFTEDGSVAVEIKLMPNADGPMKLAFLIRDTGKGISTDQAAKIFAPFAQADVSTTRRFGGTGLGLILSKKLAKALGGDVTLLASELGQGSTFLVTIDPGNIERVNMQNFEHSMNQRVASGPLTATNLQHFNILVVDDSDDNRTLVTHFLRGTGATFDTASDGKIGVEKALTGNFGLVLMDLQMPIMDGYAATRELRLRGYGGPIVALTAHAMKDERRRCLDNGFDEHLSKPIDRVLLARTIAHYANLP